ncbi:MAG: hypothetical protein Ct9H90mP4_10130 [Gammaproteobacteria bacterium]|nr:MAG: hypothetical protein Ct9H90mP4_10130 [Gammaproteobacteria bacterium]
MVQRLYLDEGTTSATPERILNATKKLAYLKEIIMEKQITTDQNFGQLWNVVEMNMES